MSASVGDVGCRWIIMSEGYSRCWFGAKPALVLVVDDNEANLALFEQVLSDVDGVRVECVSDPRNAEDRFLADRPDVVILDLHMPYLGGMEVLDVLRAHVGVGEFLPFLIITADSSVETRHEALSRGATDFMTKPIDVVETRLRVERVLETRRLHLELEAERSRLDEAVAERTAELAAVNEHLRGLADSKDQFLAAVSHELRTPLSAVLGFARELADRVDSLESGEVAEFASIIAEQSTDSAALIDDLLVAARSKIDGVAVLSGVVDVGSQLEQVIAPMSWEVRSRISRPDTEVSVVGDPLRLRQILRNLVRNAVIHGGPNISVEFGVDAGGWVEIRVIDDGGGVPDAERHLLFETPLETLGKRVRPGSMGLGLFVSRYLARLMGGDLLYRPDEAGAVFVLRLSPAESGRETRVA